MTDKSIMNLSRSIINLRLDGLSFDEIAYKLGMETATAIGHAGMALVVLPCLIEDEITAIRSLEYMRLDALLANVFQKAEAGDLEAVGRVFEIMDRRAKLVDLDNPERNEIDPSWNNGSSVH